MKKLLSIEILFALLVVGGVGVAHAQAATITSFNASSDNVVTAGTLNFTWAGSNANEYRLYLTCPSGVSAIFEKNESCNVSIPLGQNTSASLKFTNTTPYKQVIVKLQAYGSNDKPDQESQLTIIVSSGDNAKINSFTFDKTTVNTSFNNNKPTAQFTAFFSGSNTDTWKMTLDCPLPTTVSGLEERIDLIKTGGAGISSPSKEGQQCNMTQEGSASLTQFGFLVINPFKTPQSVTLTLGAYSWDGTKNIRGEVQSKTLTVLPN